MHGTIVVSIIRSILSPKYHFYYYGCMGYILGTYPIVNISNVHRNELFLALEWERSDKFYSPIIDLKNIAKIGQFEGLDYKYLSKILPRTRHNF